MKKESMNNKGFSLVELIIVIAIMAILIVVLAPQYLKYVEKSRVSADQASIQGYIDAMQVIAADPDVTLSGTLTMTKTAGAKTVAISSDLQKFINTSNGEGLMGDDEAQGCDVTSTAYTAAAIDIELQYDSSKKV
ncbi:MAG: prepilin-type N-terminal cleavage/methylation domain-containing protein, partial [Lachnospiraceae bacterium]|nr:prepilin-type N-terminal cleavage/methylation domain-containing protein [Lachnospiraceae bacterium]